MLGLEHIFRLTSLALAFQSLQRQLLPTPAPLGPPSLVKLIQHRLRHQLPVVCLVHRIRLKRNLHRQLVVFLVLRRLTTERLVPPLVLVDYSGPSPLRQRPLVASLVPNLLLGLGLHPEACLEIKQLGRRDRQEVDYLGSRNSNSNYNNNRSRRLRSEARPLQRELVVNFLYMM